MFSTTTTTVTGTTGTFTGNLLSNTLPNTLGVYTNALSVTNNGNWLAPCTITVTGSCSNCQIINFTNNRQYRLNGSTTLLVHDTTNPNNDPLSQLVVTDNGNDISANRES